MLVTSVWLASPTPAPPLISKVTPDGVPTRATGVVSMPAQRSIVVGAVAVGVGLAVTVVLAVVKQPVEELVTVATYVVVVAGLA